MSKDDNTDLEVRVAAMEILLTSLYTSWAGNLSNPHSSLSTRIEAMVTSVHNSGALPPEAPHFTKYQVFLRQIEDRLRHFGGNVAKLLDSIDHKK